MYVWRKETKGWVSSSPYGIFQIDLCTCNWCLGSGYVPMGTKWCSRGVMKVISWFFATRRANKTSYSVCVFVCECGVYIVYMYIHVRVCVCVLDYEYVTVLATRFKISMYMNTAYSVHTCMLHHPLSVYMHMRGHLLEYTCTYTCTCMYMYTYMYLGSTLLQGGCDGLPKTDWHR